MPDSKFLEEYPLYRKFPFDIPPLLSQLPKPKIHMECLICKSEQTFQMVNNYYDRTHRNDEPAKGKVVRAIYQCAACETFERDFFILISEDKDYVMKVGQNPSWDISLDKNLSKMLNDHDTFYKRGLICESQGYGIGAVAYYRRIVEEIIGSLLESIEELLGEKQKEKYHAALEKVKKTKVTQDKIKLVKDLLPPILRPGGVNPLSVLHSSLSEGLHGKSEDECLEIANTIKESLVFLVNQVLLTSKQSEEFTRSIRKVLKKQEKNGS